VHLCADLELITPAYVGGADLARADGLRPPSIKAQLRFWWRTLHPDLAPADLFAAESRIFGDTEFGQGLRVIPRTSVVGRTECPPAYGPQGGSTLFYMAYGTQGGRGEPPRHRTAAGTRCTIDLAVPARCTAAETDEVQTALWLLTTFGGVGTRARRGFGSLSLGASLGGWPRSNDFHDHGTLFQALSEALAALPASVHAGQPRHTALSSRARLAVGPGAGSWEGALNAAGTVYYGLRRALGTTYDHTNRGEPVGMDFFRIVSYRSNGVRPAPDDHATYGAAFGLPQNYRFSDRSMLSLEAAQGNAKVRRASPVMFRVSKLANGKYVPIVLWLPSLFLPAGYRVTFNAPGQPAQDLQSPRDDMLKALFAASTPLRRWMKVDPPVPVPTVMFRGYAGWPGWKVTP
jgi:CRISPR-associated protein Cmr1